MVVTNGSAAISGLPARVSANRLNSDTAAGRKIPVENFTDATHTSLPQDRDNFVTIRDQVTRAKRRILWRDRFCVGSHCGCLLRRLRFIFPKRIDQTSDCPVESSVREIERMSA
jgi:hypothetical protein